MRKLLLLGTALLLSWQTQAQVVKQDPASAQTLTAIVSGSQSSKSSALSNKNLPDYWPDRVFIKLKNQNISLQTFETQANRPARVAADKVNRSLHQFATQRVSELPRSSKLPSFKNTYEVVLNDPEQLSQLIQEFKLMPEVEYVERVPYYVTHTSPNDPEFISNKQYAMSKIQAVEAFGIHRGTTKTLVAIVDDAFLISHPDLIANVDVARSYDVADRDSNPQPPSSGVNKAGPNTFSHGTHTAGIAGAVTNNGVGISSVSNNRISIMGVKCTTDETVNTRSIERSAEGIVYAINQGARVISMSFGGPGRSQTIQNIINEAAANGVVFIASAGNDNVETIQYPAGYDNVIAVASSDDKDVKSSFSNFGSWVDLSAPGTGILSTVTGTDGASGAYTSYNGTSMSTPMVAGMVALMLSENPNLTAKAIEQILKSTADNIDNAVGQSLAHSGKLGAGRINAFKAIQAIQSLSPAAAPAAITNLLVTRTAKTEADLSWSAPGLGETDKATLYDIRYATAPITSENFDAATRTTTNIIPATVGTAQILTVRNLEPNTDYYFAIVARSFYGEGSGLSNVVTTRTLDAARIQADAAPLTLAVNRDELAIVSENILLRNIGAIPLNYSISINPTAGSNIITHAKTKLSADGKVGLGGSSFIAATKFTAGPRGFHLTHVQNFINNSAAVLGAAIGIKIMKGGENPKDGVLLTSQTFTRNVPAGGEMFTFKLEQPQHIQAGEVFWVAFVLPEGLDFPQGYDNIGAKPATFFISQDNGNTYGDAQTMAAFLNAAAFKIKAIQAHWLSLTPALDVIESNAIRNLLLTIDTEDVVNGTYQADLLLSSDDPVTPSIKKSVTITINGGQPKLTSSASSLDFGSLFVGAEKTQKVMITNTGVAAMVLNSPTFSTGNFPAQSFSFSPTLPLTILPGTQQELSIKFIPGVKEALSGTVTLATNDPDVPSLTVNLAARLINPPVAALTASALNLTVNKATGTTAAETIKLRNTGEADLSYNLKVQLDATEVIKYDPDKMADNFIGYNNVSVPFWSAMKFNVSAPSFTLTNVSNYYRTQTAEDRTITMKVYKGGAMPTAGTLLLEQSFETDLSADNGSSINIPLKQPLNFVQNDVFWVVFAFNGVPYPQGNNTVASGAGRNYYSQNGTAWTAYETGTFKIRALGLTSMWLSATPASGLVPTGETSLSAQVDASKLAAGSYTGRVLVATNDPSSTEKAVNITLTVIDNTVTGMEDEAEAFKFFVYPNPTAIGKVKIALTLENRSDVHVKLYNLNGQVLHHKTSKKVAGAYEEEVNLKGIAAGLYLIQVQYDNKLLTRRILIH